MADEGRYVSRAHDEALADPDQLEELAGKIRLETSTSDDALGWKVIAATFESCARKIRLQAAEIEKLQARLA